MSEKTAYQRLRKNIMRRGDRLTRIENLVGSGIPDTNGCFEGVEFWLEIKCPREPKRPSTPLFGSNHKLTTEQENFLIDQHKAGGLGWVYIETDKGLVLLISGEHAERINTMTLGDLLAASAFHFNTKGADENAWTLLRGAIRGR